MSDSQNYGITESLNNGSASQHGEDGHFGCAVIEQDFGAFVSGGTCGEDVVDQDDGFVLNEGGGVSFDGESVLEVFESFGSAEACLCLGVAGSAEDVMSWNAGSC